MFATKSICDSSGPSYDVNVGPWPHGRGERYVKALMNSLTLVLLVAGALAGGYVVGLAGFGTALMALGIWLYALPPSVAVPLVLISSVVAQTSTMPSMWRSIDFKLVLPFLIGGLAGVPLGTMLIAHADPKTFKLSVGVFLLIFPAALYFNRTPIAWSFGGRAADGLVGFVGGILGGLAGLSGPLPILWASVRGWGKDERRGIFQIFNWTVLAVALCLQAGTGLITMEVIRLALLTLPVTIFGAWLGARTYHMLSDGNFRDVVLGLLFLSGIGLVWSSLGLQ
jgi:uncharacterized membrane protein YfcA